MWNTQTIIRPGPRGSRFQLAFSTLLLALSGAQAASADLSGARSKLLVDGFQGNVLGGAHSSDALGQEIAVGDFDGDGRGDLAISDSESLDSDSRGAVHILYPGSTPMQDWIMFDRTELGAFDSEPDDEFGKALASGDFNGDGFDDLAVGIPGEDVDGVSNAGMVAVTYGSAAGLAPGGPPAIRFRLGVGVSGTPRSFDQMGSELASGDFDQDGRDDLAIGLPGRQLGGNSLAGEVLVLYGSSAGLATADHRFFSQDSTGPDGEMQDLAEAFDHFGATLATGDFNGDLFDDLAIAAPGESLPNAGGGGVVHVLYGFPSAPGLRGLRLTNNQAWNEANIGASGGLPETGDNFGTALAAGDLTNDGIDDLAIGAPYEDYAGFENCGAVTVMFGQFGVGLHPDDATFLTQSHLSDGEELFPFDQFGFALAIGEFASSVASSGNDLAIGIPNEDVLTAGGNEVGQAGAATIVPGGQAGLDRLAARLWAEGYRGSVGTPRRNDFYGHALASGDLDGNGYDDLVIGATGVDGLFDPGTPSNLSGAVYILFGALFADGFETGDSDVWSGTTP